MTNRTRACACALAAILVAGLTACGAGPGEPGESGEPSSEPAGTPPHVLVLLVDDLGWADVGFTGGKVPTPYLDALASESLVLERFYAAPMCSPARAELMTARHAPSMGMTRNVKPRDTGGLPLGLRTLPEALSEAGYATALAGKWHLGHGSAELEPNGRGFDQSYGHLRGWVDYYTHMVDGRLDWHRNGKPLQEEGYTTDLIAQEAQRALVERPKDQPLFLLVAFNAPHTPLQGPGDRRAASPANARETYIEMVQRLDLRIGDILGTLEEQGMASHTVVWFMSDNGANPKYGGSNEPLRGGKYTCHEGGLRVPSCVRFASELDPGRSGAFIGIVDVAPTLLSWAKAKALPGVHGLDRGPALAGQQSSLAPTYEFAVDHAKTQRRAILNPPWKLIREVQGGEIVETLYDVVADPYERNDRYADRPAVVGKLQALAAW